jgi:hypothetical protein
VDIVKMVLREMDWMYLAHDRNQWGALVNEVMNEPSGSMKCWEVGRCTVDSFSRRAQLHE